MYTYNIYCIFRLNQGHRCILILYQRSGSIQQRHCKRTSFLLIIQGIFSSTWETTPGKVLETASIRKPSSKSRTLPFNNLPLGYCKVLSAIQKISKDKSGMQCLSSAHDICTSEMCARPSCTSVRFPWVSSLENLSLGKQWQTGNPSLMQLGFFPS